MPFREDKTEKGENVGIGFDITTSCNIKCKQCYCPTDVASFRAVSFRDIKAAIKRVSGLFSELYILGGEPTLNPELYEILKFGLDNFRMVILVTNGLKLADEEYCRKMALPGLSISMHRRAISPQSEQLLNDLAQNKSYFKRSRRAWTNVQRFWQGDVNVQLNLLKPLVDGGHVMDVFKWSRENGFEPIMELTKSGPIFERNCELDVGSTEIEKLFLKMRKYDNVYYPHLEAPELVPPSYGHNCTLIETGIHVYVDGTIVPCVSHNGIVLGNIFTDDIEEVLASPIRSAIKDYQNWIVGPCKQCAHFHYCRGGCRGEAFWDTGCPRASDPYCWNIPDGLTLKDMVPESCDGCALEDCPGCKINV